MELKRCPFCGDIAKQAYSVGKYGAFGFVECDLCGNKTKTVKLIEPYKFDNEKEFWQQSAWGGAFRAWNRRMDDRTNDKTA